MLGLNALTCFSVELFEKDKREDVVSIPIKKSKNLASLDVGRGFLIGSHFTDVPQQHSGLTGAENKHMSGWSMSHRQNLFEWELARLRPASFTDEGQAFSRTTVPYVETYEVSTNSTYVQTVANYWLYGSTYSSSNTP